MIILPDDFEIEFEGMQLKIKIHTMIERKVFEVVFPDGRKNLMISRSTVFDGSKVWMSIPEGRQKEALSIGAKIVEYFKSL
ncbi:hypothetical protein DYBT9623_00670 [Dyadobacter sp. CECT 9623]|uniref:Uncharacterized protein n=1 Tax=Dyadobacter linearis TaxID=2823330 RepID=A0ABM8UKI7_9BACT|nr:hypothetical protein [Dyadobacter sp. CECT 9623]CAG5067942.1 hypothetical protein DYBT9623_00670 [Dyadobacter sp. CECT 9623]